MPIPDSLKRVGPDGFPYVFLRIDPAPPDPHDNQTVVNVGDLWQAMLNEGYGLAAFAGDNAKPIWVFKYRDLLCLRLYPESSRHLTQRTAKMTTQRADEDIFPSYVRLALERKISATLGTPTALDPHIIEFPEMDTLKRIRLGLTANLTDDQRRAIGRELDWHLPYVVYY